MKEKDQPPAELPNLDSLHGSMVIEKEDEEAFQRFCDLRISSRTINVVGTILFLASIYMYTLSLLHPKSWYFLAFIFGVNFFVRNPLTMILIYYRNRIQRGLKSPSYLVSLEPLFPVALNILSVFSSFSLSMFLLARVLNGKCESFDQLHMWSCNSEYDSHALPQELIIALMLLPLLYSIAFKAIRTEYVFLSWVIIVVNIIIAIAISSAYQSIPALVLYIPLSLLTLWEIHRQKVLIFLLLKRQQTLMDANKKLSEESQNELRFMIANMAHDLKTPLSAFMNGVETLTSLIEECEKSYSMCSKFSHVKENLTNLNTVNSFMTMTVNRCIDYMKASKGIKLEPRLETINLQEVLSMPLNCMRDLQSRIAIIQKPLPHNVCTHIITDLQWFQENLFCLISNAVKYSSHGHITVSVTLTTTSNPRIAAIRKKTSGTHSSSAVQSTDGEIVNSFNSNHEKYSFLDRLAASSVPTPKASGGSDGSQEVDLEKGNASGKNSNSSGSNAQSTLHKRMTESALQMYRNSVVKRNKGKVYIADPTPGSNHLTIETNGEDMLFIEVEDTGIGLSDEVKQTLFTPFKQAQRRAGGTGLGLYSLAKRVDALGGYYGVSNRRDGEQGSVFWFAVPYRPDTSSVYKGTPVRRSGTTPAKSDKATPTGAVVGPISDLVVHDLTEDPPAFFTTVPAVSQKPAVTVPEGKLRILLVDDSLTILKMTSNLLRRHGHVVDQEENGAEALRALEKSYKDGNHYDVMLIDLNMPVMDGLEATKRLRETEKQYNLVVDSSNQRHQTVFAFSANSDNDALTEAMEAGADDFICKPFSIQTFNEKIEKWVMVDVQGDS